MITFTTVLCLTMLLAAGALCVLRILRRSSVPDRLVALDLLLVNIVLGTGVLTYQTQSGVFLDLLVVVSLLGFVGAVTVARFVERRGA
jgi:multicomponent Na+:H+ antiporter subunit F